MYAAGKAPLRAVVGSNSAGSEAGLVCYRTLANSPCLRAFASLRAPCQSYLLFWQRRAQHASSSSIVSV